MTVKKEDTRLEIFSFGDQPEDKFFCLVDLRISPEGLNIEKMKLADPRNFDQMLTEMGCLTMLTDMELQELVSRGVLPPDDLHSGLYQLCIKEGIIH